MAINVLTQHNDNVRSGANLNETRLNTSNVNVNQFGLLATRDVVGQIYAQPLYAAAVPTPNGSRNLVIVATMQNWVYAFDADDMAAGATSVWERQVDPNPVPATLFNPKQGDPYQDVLGTIGILSTPCIDAATHTLYLVAATCDPATLNGPNMQQAFKHLLFALDLGTGVPRPAAAGSSNPVPIAGSAPGVGYKTADPGEIEGAHVTPTAGGATVTAFVNRKNVEVTDAAANRVLFNSMQQMQRPALLLDNNLLYIAFGAHGDQDPYHGWVFAYETATLKQRGVFCATPAGGRAGVWQAGEGLVADATGRVYCGTGNGDSKSNGTGGPNLGESYIRLSAGATSLNLDAFDTAFKDPAGGDEDLGAASPTILPDGFLVGGGKDGNFYLLDPGQLTNTGANAVVQVFLASRGAGSRQTNTHHIHGSPVVYDSPEHGLLVYVWGENDVLRAYRYDPVAHRFPDQPNQRDAPSAPLALGVLFATIDDQGRKGMPGGFLSISADHKTPGSAILWASVPPWDDANHATVRGELVAYAASQFEVQNGRNRLVQLWRSSQNTADDALDTRTFAKFCCPTVADGKVFLATFSNELRIFGLRQVPNGGYNIGFGGTTGLTFNGSARGGDTPGTIRLVGQHLFQAGSVFSTAPVTITRFTSTFEMRIFTDKPKQMADGLTFCIQSEGPHALGGWGGGLGYGLDPSDQMNPGFVITKSVAVKFDLFDERIPGPRSSLGVYVNGAAPIATTAINGEVALAPDIDLQSGHTFDVRLDYDGAQLTVQIHDQTTKKRLTHTVPVNIPATVLGNTAHVGFTAATGGVNANFDISNWQFTTV